jgi:hypothetical protein
MAKAILSHLQLGFVSKSVAGAVDVTLTEAEASVGFLKLTGAITGNISVILPATGNFLAAGNWWIVNNATTGAFTLTFKGSTGTGIVVASGKTAILYSDATNIVRATNDTT